MSFLRDRSCTYNFGAGEALRADPHRISNLPGSILLPMSWPQQDEQLETVTCGLPVVSPKPHSQLAKGSPRRASRHGSRRRKTSQVTWALESPRAPISAQIREAQLAHGFMGDRSCNPYHYFALEEFSGVTTKVLPLPFQVVDLLSVKLFPPRTVRHWISLILSSLYWQIFLSTYSVSHDKMGSLYTFTSLRLICYLTSASSHLHFHT